jgi:hypothetical protein
MQTLIREAARQLTLRARTGIPILNCAQRWTQTCVRAVRREMVNSSRWSYVLKDEILLTVQAFSLI